MRNIMFAAFIGATSMLALPVSAQITTKADASTQQDPSKTKEMPAGTPHIDHIVVKHDPNAEQKGHLVRKKVESASKSEPAGKVGPATEHGIADVPEVGPATERGVANVPEAD